MKRSELERRTPLRSDAETTRAFVQRGRMAAANAKPRAISPASPEQRRAIAGRPCIVCGSHDQVDPAHIIDRSLLGDGQDDPRACVPMCRFPCHRDYDDGRLSLLEYLEPNFREELAFAVHRTSLIQVLERTTNERWRPISEERAA